MESETDHFDSIDGTTTRTLRRRSRLAAQSHGAAIERIEAIAADEGIDCDFARVNGYRFLAEGDKSETLDQELAAAHRAGLLEVSPRACAFHVEAVRSGTVTLLYSAHDRLHNSAVVLRDYLCERLAR